MRNIVQVKRSGGCLILDYKLLGRGGESYYCSEEHRSPGFVVYKGQSQIASGQFEYG